MGRDLEFTKGDHCDDGPYFWPGKVWTPSRPVDDDNLPKYHEDETVPEDVVASEIPLVAPWEPRYWFSEIRSSYLSTVRYYNGWIPWYGTRPNPMWYRAHSLAAFADMEATYVDETEDREAGTEVWVDFPSHRTRKMNPGGRYRWDIRSAVPLGDTADPTGFTYVRTHIAGKVSVRAEWSLGIDIKEP
jgi:hypothetical protein